MNPTDPYETGFPKKGTYEKIPYRDSVGNLGFRHLSLGTGADAAAETVILAGLVKQAEAWVVAGAKLQVRGTWPVAGAGAEERALAEAGGKAVKETGGEDKSTHSG